MTLARTCLLMGIFLKTALGVNCSSTPPRQVILPSGWRAVTPEDLPNDDQDLWQRYHADKCPGIAEGGVAGAGRKSYAIALLHNDAKGNLLQQLIVWLWTGTSFSKIVLVRPVPVVTGPFVVWAAPAGESHKLGWRRASQYSSRVIRLREDGGNRLAILSAKRDVPQPSNRQLRRTHRSTIKRHRMQIAPGATLLSSNWSRLFIRSENRHEGKRESCVG
jgi:hypothetical protein